MTIIEGMTLAGIIANAAFLWKLSTYINDLHKEMTSVHKEMGNMHKEIILVHKEMSQLSGRVYKIEGWIEGRFQSEKPYSSEF